MPLRYIGWTADSEAMRLFLWHGRIEDDDMADGMPNTSYVFAITAG